MRSKLRAAQNFVFGALMQDDKASQTAYTVVQGLMMVASQPETTWLVSPDKRAACERILNSSDEGRKRLRQLQSPLARFGLRLMERLLLPGIALHYVTRKQAIEDVVRAEIAQGMRQCVNLGAGFDTLMYELARAFPDLNFIELDHPATAAQKRRAFDRDAPGNLHLHPVDLAKTPIGDALAQVPAFDPTARSCFICEGVLMYLIPQDVARVFDAVAQATTGGVRFVFTAVPGMDSPNTNATWLLKRYLHRLGEPLHWTIERDDITGFVAAQGFRTDQVVGGPDMRRRYLSRLPDARFHQGEYVVSCVPQLPE